jgi:hypothetical protein
MRRLLITIQYDGTAYHGWQVQKNALSVQEVFQDAVEKEGLADYPITVALMGCIVNGPGEAHEADIGIAGGKGAALLFAHGESLGKIKENEIIERSTDFANKYNSVFAKVLTTNKERDNTIVMDGEYESVINPDADKWWILHVYYGIHTTKEKHYTVYSEEEATKIYNEWMKWALKMQKEKGIGYWKLCDIEAYEVENPSHSDNRDDWYYSNWSPRENI